jgi:hypothetical protein
MQATKRLIIATMAVGLIAALPGTALAEDGTRGDAVATDQVTDRPVDNPTDHPTDKATDRPTDKPTNRPTDRCIQRLIDRACVDDRPTEPPTDRCLTATDHPTWCVDDHRPHDLNVRQLIWRLINAHEWEKLIRLFHWLGWL